MRLAVHGDSWFWIWNYTINTPIVAQEMSKLYGGEFHNSIPLMEILLNHMGHTIENYCFPGQDFNITTTKIDTIPTTADYSLVFYSADFRTHTATKFILDHNESLENLVEAWDKHTTQNLIKIRDRADKHQHHTIILGGQGTIMPGVFESVPESKYFHLMSPCILTDIWLDGIQPDGAQHLRFKLCDFAHSQNQDLEKYHSDIVSQCYYDLEAWTRSIGPYAPLDGGHLDANSTILFLNLLFLFIERINNSRNINI